MDDPFLFNFKTAISTVNIPSKLNNPFGAFVPEIAQIAAKEFQAFIASESHHWHYDFGVRPGKMFGVLVVQKQDASYCYLGTASGELSREATCDKFTPPVFNEAIDDYYFRKGMLGVTAIGAQIKNCNDPVEIRDLKEKRRQKSIGLQQYLFENSKFLNGQGKVKNTLEIFEMSAQVKPPAATGECAAPKMLQYALQNDLKPIALAEFWWGNTSKDNKRVHQVYYPSCKAKCQPILEYMLDDETLWSQTR